MTRAALSALSFLVLLGGCPKPPTEPKQPSPNTPDEGARVAANSTAKEPAPTPEPPKPPAHPCEGKEEVDECLNEQLGDEELEGLPLGMSSKEVLALLKKPAKKGKVVEEGATGLFLQDWSYPKLGLSIEMGAESAKGEQSINRITATAPCERKTKRGVKIGDSLEDARKLYVNAIRPGEEADPNSFVAGSVFGGGILFRAENGVITEIFLGQMAE